MKKSNDIYMNVVLFDKEIDNRAINKILEIFHGKIKILMVAYIFSNHEENYSSNKVIYYQFDNVQKVRDFLNKKEIDICIFTAPYHFVNILFLYLLKERNYITVFLQHGLIIDDVNKLLKKDLSMLFLKNGIVKYVDFLKIIIRNFKLINKKAAFLKQLFKRFFSIVSNPSKNLYQLYALQELRCDYALVFSKKDVDVFVSYHGYKNENVFTFGYFSCIRKENTVKNEDKCHNILYISSGLAQCNFGGYNYEKESIVYRKLINEICSDNTKLIIRIHPLDDYDRVKNMLSDSEDNFVISQKESLEELVLNAKIILAEYTTALFYAIYYYKPVLILKHYIKKYPFDYLQYGIGKEVHIDSVGKKLEEENIYSIEMVKYIEFLEQYVLPDATRSLDMFIHRIQK